MTYVPDLIIEKIEKHKTLGQYEEAMKLVNGLLQKNPKNQDALLQVADIQYRKGDMGKAAKAVDFLNAQSDNSDPMGLYIKGVLEMEKNHWGEARVFFKKALEITDAKNHEILRCYGLSEYRYGNREKGINSLKDAFSLFPQDAELICNLVQVYTLEKEYKNAERMIRYYDMYREQIQVIDQSIEYYDQKIIMFKEFLKITCNFTL